MKPSFSISAAIIAAATLGLDLDASGAPPTSPISPAASLPLFHLPEGLRIELVASEPEVVDPVEVRFDEDGRMWVVEMHDYPHVEDEQQQGSRIRVLEDPNGDGRYETARTFAENLPFANGLQPWQGGVIVTLSGRIAFLKDTSGDGRADVQQTWFRGFSEQNPQLRVNHPRFGPDNHIYVTNGLRGGEVIDLRREGAQPVSLGGRDFRFDPNGVSSSAVSGFGQFGLTFDDFGQRFVCSNRNPLIHVVLQQRYLRRNPLLPVPAVVHDVAAAGAASRVYPLTRAWTTSNLHAGQFTAACGTLIYRGDALPAAMTSNAFTCEPTGNLVHREIIEPHGATFTSRPAREGIEFLASTDEWFRPVNLTLGPDGALYVVDMYRAVIEHPQFMPEELKERRDLRGGDDRGRIYRITAEDSARPRVKARLSDAPAAELARHLEHPGAWWRQTAARLIYERQDDTAVPTLVSILRHSDKPTARVQALNSLSGLGRLTEEHVHQALDDPHPRVQETAVRFSESWIATSRDVREAVSQLAEDSDARVRFQVALSLGDVPTEATGCEEVVAALAQIAHRDAEDVWVRRAIATAVPDAADPLLIAILADFDSNDSEKAGQLQLIRDLAMLVGSRRDAEALGRVLLAANHSRVPSIQNRIALVVFAGLTGGLSRQGGSLAELTESLSPAEAGPVIELTAALFATAVAIAEDEDAPKENRHEAIDLLRYAPFATARDTLTNLASDAGSLEMQLAAVDALAAHRHPAVARVLIDDLPSQTPAIKRARLDALLRDARRAGALLDAIEAGRVAATDIDTLRAGRLLKHSDAAIRDRAKHHFAGPSTDRRDVFAGYQTALAVDGDRRGGKEVFRRACSSCHRIDGVGTDVGPDITDSRIKTPLQLLTDILMPNQAIDGNYINYSAVTSDGRVHSGMIASESATTITLKNADKATVTLLRDDVEQLASSGKSLMPEGLEREITVEQMADLISFIKNWRYPDSGIPIEEAR